MGLYYNDTISEDASDISFTPAGTIAATDVQTAIEEVASEAGGTTYQDYIGSPMIVTGGEITEGTNAGTFKVAALTALLRKTDSDTGELDYVTKTEEDNIAITLADTNYYVILNYNAGSPTISLITDTQAFNDEIPLGSVMKTASNEVFIISGCYRLQNGVAKLHYRAFEIYHLHLTSGNTIAYSGTNNFIMNAGVIYEGINRLTQIAYDSAVTQFKAIYQDNAGGWTEVNANVIDFAHYDDGDGTLGNISPNQYSCHWVYRHVDDGSVYVLYGRDSYTLAEAEVAEIPALQSDHLTNFGCLIGRIVAPVAGGSFASVAMATDTVFAATAVATHNELGGLNAGDYNHLTAAEYADLTAGYRTIYIDAAEMISATTAGCSLQGTKEYGVNDIDVDYLAFDGGATEERAQFKIKMPENWDRLTIKAKFDWSTATGSTAGDTVEWGIKAGALSDNDAIDTALGTPQVISDVLLADNGADLQTTAKTPAVTVGGTPAINDMLMFEVYRNTDGTDNCAEDAHLFGLTLQYKLSGAVAAW